MNLLTSFPSSLAWPWPHRHRRHHCRWSWSLRLRCCPRHGSSCRTNDCVEVGWFQFLTGEKSKCSDYFICICNSTINPKSVGLTKLAFADSRCPNHRWTCAPTRLLPGAQGAIPRTCQGPVTGWSSPWCCPWVGRFIESRHFSILLIDYSLTVLHDYGALTLTVSLRSRVGGWP